MYALINDSSKNKIASNKWNTTSGAIAVERAIGYFDWGNDYIWLPSFAETGGYSSKSSDMSIIGNANGLWHLDSSQRGVSSGKSTWLRNGAGASISNAPILDCNGEHTNTLITDTVSSTANGLIAGTLGVRPCFNLNLTLAESSSATGISAPNAFSAEYNGSAQKISASIASWYTTSYANAVNVILLFNFSIKKYLIYTLLKSIYSCFSIQKDNKAKSCQSLNHYRNATYDNWP